MTEITWNELTADEREALIAIKWGEVSNDLSQPARLFNMGLIEVNKLNSMLRPTDAGRAVLAQKPTEKTVNSNERPVTITAYEFFDENYERKIREGLCKVTYDGVEYKQFLGKSLGNTQLGSDIGVYTFRDSMELTVEWLQPAEKTVKLRVPSADGLYYEVLYTDGTWEGEEVHGEQ